MRTTPRPRSGLSIVEVIVALMLIAIGLLGMAGTSALALRSSTDAGAERRATLRATSRLARLSVLGCGLPASGSLDADGMRERWTVAPASAGFAQAEVQVAWRRSNGRPGTLLLRSALLC